MTNQEQARYRNGGEAAPWLVEERYDRTVARVSEALHAAPEPYAAPEPSVAPDGLLGYRARLVTASRTWQ